MCGGVVYIINNTFHSPFYNHLHNLRNMCHAMTYLYFELLHIFFFLQFYYSNYRKQHLKYNAKPK